MHKHSILLVEDDPMISEIYHRKFTQAGFEVELVQSGPDVLKKAAEKHFDLILLDLVLPGMDGLSVLRELKQSGKYDANLNVAIFSNLNDRENQEKAIEYGAVGFIPKSDYNPSELVKEVERMLHEIDERGRHEESVELESKVENNGKTILFIEDEEVFSEMFGGTLHDEGYQVEYATTGAEGLRKLESKPVDLVITDMLMPTMRGDEIIEIIRKDSRFQNLPIVVISASASPEEIQKIEELGITEYHEKTHVTPGELLKRVNKILKS